MNKFLKKNGCYPSGPGALNGLIVLMEFMIF